MANGESPSRVILDPSVLFTEEALAWMEDPELKEYLVVSEALLRRLGDAEAGEQFAPYAEPEASRVEEVRAALERNEIARFSYGEASERGEIPDGAREICERLLASEESLADVLADEWAFLTSQSLAMISKRARHALEAFGRAGARVVEIIDEQMVAALESVRERIPPGLLERMKQVDDFTERIPKLILIGGGFAAGAFVPPLGLSMTIAEALIAGNAVIAGDP